ncbi:hypothetical protein PRZ48_010415 [Zasmidium cellare]|uniref:Alpha/beta hydrolase fold-3 domain-containing protein n=1 Tax=Zasmidium cellare TaxID=395010 RepID=A0ABR0E8J9_ZASCE|nr:hypothetical protein PRZ48_010415 [Zasmidium cellare]
MTAPRLSAEWQELVTKRLDIAKVPSSVEEYKKLKHQRGLDGQAFLSHPDFALLKSSIHVENTIISLPDVPDHQFPIRVYRPTRTGNRNLPVMIYFHGGFWVAGDANTEDLGCRAIIAHGNDIVIVSFEYRLVGDVDWQSTFSDAERAVVWLASNASQFGGDVYKGYLVSGAEGGCHLAAISAIRVRDRHPEVKITGQCLIVPTTIAWPDAKIPEDWRRRLESHEEHVDAPVMNERLYEELVGALKMSDEEKRKGENFPCLADLKGLPPAYLPMDECDPTRDQGFLYAELLREAGVMIRTDYYRGLPNMFVNFPELPTTLKAGGHLAAGIAWLLESRNFRSLG